jgi:hypothetical protein
MAVRRKLNKTFKGVQMKSGHFYTFKYQAWEHDPRPVIILMYALDGINLKADGTRHEWRFFQGINFTYIPRSIRKTFINDWKRTWIRTGGNPRFTWEMVQRRYPYLKGAVRRYFFKPNYYITDLQEIPFDDLDKLVVSTWSKDFSKKLKMSLLAKFRTAMRGRFGGTRRR